MSLVATDRHVQTLSQQGYFFCYHVIGKVVAHI